MEEFAVGNPTPLIKHIICEEISEVLKYNIVDDIIDHGYSALHMACEKHISHENALIMVKHFISKGVNVEKCIDERGNTPLHWAAGSGHDDVIIELLKYSEKLGSHFPLTLLNIKNKMGKTALDFAIHNNNKSTISLLQNYENSVAYVIN